MDKKSLKTIIIEGVNGVGKSTLARKLEEYGDGKLKHDDDVYEDDFKKGYIARVSAPRTTDLIMDRSPLTEYVYGTTLREHSEVNEDDIVEIFKVAKKTRSLEIVYLEGEKEVFMERLIAMHKNYETLVANYEKLKAAYDKIIQILEANGFEIKKINTTNLSSAQVFKSVFPLSFKLLVCGNLSHDLIVTTDGSEFFKQDGGAAFNTAFASSLILRDKSIAIHSTVGIDYDIRILSECGFDTRLVYKDSKHKTLSFRVGEDFCDTLSHDTYLKFPSLNGQQIYVDHLHICCRDSHPKTLDIIKNVRYKTFSIDTMSYALEYEPAFVNFLNALEFKPAFVFCNSTEYAMITERLGIDLTKKFETTAIVTNASWVLVISDGVERFRLIQPKTPLERIKSTVGAGDSFQGSFLGKIINGEAIKESIIYAMSVASISIEDTGVKHLSTKSKIIAEKTRLIIKMNTEIGDINK